MKNVYVLLASVFLFVSCVDQKENRQMTADYTMYIHQEMGEIYENNITQTGLPFHIGYINGIAEKKIECILIGKKISKRRKIAIDLIGELLLKENEKQSRVIVAIPKMEKWRTISPNDFTDFVTRYSRTKTIVENWMVERCGLYCGELIKWNDEAKAELFLNLEMN